MTNQTSSNLHTVLGVISLIVGILGFIFSFVPCFGAYSIYAGGGGLLCGIGAIFYAKKANAGIGLAVAGIVMSILASAVALWQMNNILS
jgi:hypothetical protein